jgi:hypothetical protein
MANEHFKLGTKIALFSTRSFGKSNLRSGTVSKVRKDSKFFVDGGDVMYTPSRFGNAIADRSGDSQGYSRQHVEPWSAKHDERIAESKRRALYNHKSTKIVEIVRELRLSDAGHRAVIDAVYDTLILHGLVSIPEVK